MSCTVDVIVFVMPLSPIVVVELLLCLVFYFMVTNLNPNWIMQNYDTRLTIHEQK